MKTRTTSAPVLVVIAVLALVVGCVGTATAVGLTRGQVKKIAAKVVKKKATTLSVAHATTADTATNAGNATSLNGQPASTYLTQVSTVNLSPVTGVTSVDKALPSVPAGSYLVSIHLTATVGNATDPLNCAVYQQGGAPNYVDAYGSKFGAFHTIDASRVVTIPTGAAIRYSCQANGATLTIPVTASYGQGQISFVRINTDTSLGSVRGTEAGAASAGGPTP